MTEKLWVALLDANGVLTGFDEDPATIPPTAVTVPAECTLRPSQYRWDGVAFWPILPGEKAARQRLETEMARVLWQLLKEIKQLHPAWTPPPLIQKWFQAYQKFGQ